MFLICWEWEVLWSSSEQIRQNGVAFIEIVLSKYNSLYSTDAMASPMDMATAVSNFHLIFNNSSLDQWILMGTVVRYSRLVHQRFDVRCFVSIPGGSHFVRSPIGRRGVAYFPKGRLNIPPDVPQIWTRPADLWITIGKAYIKLSCWRTRRRAPWPFPR